MATLTPEQLQTNTEANNKANPLYNNTITASSLAPVAPVQISPTQDIGNGSDLTSGVQSGVDQFQADQERYLKMAENTQGDNSFQALLNDYLTTANQNTGQGAAQLQAEQQLGLPDLQKQRATSQGLIKTGLAEYNAMKAEYDKSIADAEITAGKTGQTYNMFLGTQGAIERQKLAGLNNKAADIGILQAQDLALAGNIEAAQNTANRAVDLMYKDREALLATKKLQYDLNKDILEKTDAKRAKALEYALGKEEQKIKDEKEFQKSLSDMTITALSAGAPQSVIDASKKAKTTLEAAQILGKYSPETLKYELLKEQIKTEKAQRANINSQISERNTSSTTGGKLTADEKKANTASVNLVGLLDDYKKEIEGINFLQANSPAKRTAINSLKGRITAEYKQAKQLGTLDAGVQKLIDSIIPNPGSLAVSSLNNAAQVKAINDFRASFLPQTPEGQYVEKMIPMIQKSNNTTITSSSYADSL